MSHAGVQMKSLSMMVPSHIFKPWCQYLLVGMPWCKCPLVLTQTQFIQKFPLFSKSRFPQRLKNIFKSWFVISRKVIFLFFDKCLIVGMPWFKCPLVGMPWCECFDANTIYSKIPFVFKIKAPLALEKYFRILICYFSKSHLFFFWLKAPQKIGDHC